MNLVVGATGMVGTEVCARLKTAGKPVKALVRSTAAPEKVERLKNLGVSLFYGDLKQPTSLAAACRGVETVISTASATLSRGTGDSLITVDRDGQLALVDAARASGVKRFIYVSFRPKREFDYPLQEAKRRVEESLKSSGLDYTILQASYFLEVWLSPALGFDYPNAKATVFGDGTKKISWISLFNVADFAVACVGNPKASRRILEIGGPEALAPLEVVHTFEEIAGRKFTVQHVPEEQLRAQLASATDLMGQTFAGLQLGYALGDAIDMRKTLAEFPVSLTRIRDYARRVLGA